MVFNVVARNQHDHVKNIAFLMNPLGEWSLAPAFDVTYSFNPAGARTGTHQMTLNGKRDGFTREDFVQCACSALMKRGRAAAMAHGWPIHSGGAKERFRRRPVQGSRKSSCHEAGTTFTLMVLRPMSSLMHGFPPAPADQVTLARAFEGRRRTLELL
jgi:hypothetical protein